MVAMTLLTGAFHEDGLADTADGLGGGWTTADKLRIMKDSRIGTYGGMALLLLVLLKYSALLAMPAQWVGPTLVCAHVVARWSVLPLLRWLPYVGGEKGSGVSIAGAADTAKVVTTTVFAACVLGVLLPAGLLIAILLCLMILCCSGWLYRRQLGGVTGDTLGATNQVVEVGIYLAVVASVPV